MALIVQLSGWVARRLVIEPSLRAVPATALEHVYAEFIQQTKEAVAVPRGGVRYLRRLAGRALGETKAQEIFVDQQQSALDRLASAEPSAIASVMENEHPQLVAALHLIEGDILFAAVGGEPMRLRRCEIEQRANGARSLLAGAQLQNLAEKH